MTGSTGCGWQLVEAADHDLEELMSWFGGAGEVNVWGGPGFRFPFTEETFREDCRWGRMPSFRLNSPAGEFSAFGQMYERYGRINLARLVVNPLMRGRGTGKRLVLQKKTGEARLGRPRLALLAK